MSIIASLAPALPHPPTVYTIEATARPGQWSVWYANAHGWGFNGELYDCMTVEAAEAAQRKRAAVYGWNVEAIRFRTTDTRYVDRRPVEWLEAAVAS